MVMRPDLEFDPPMDRCPLCGSGSIGWYDRDARGVQIHRCAECGVRFMNPQYTTAALDRFYASYVACYELSHDPRRRARRRAQKQRSFDLIEKYRAPGRLLSVGSGDGVELEVALERGWEAIGHDLDPAAAAEVAARTGVAVLTGDLIAQELPAGSLECVFMDHVLEHLRDPASYLSFVKRALAPGGILYVGVPNIASISSRWQESMGRLGLKRRTRGRHYDTGHHLFYYSPRSVRHVLEQCFGLSVLRIRGDPKVWRPALDPRGLPARLQHVLPWLDSSMRVVALNPSRQDQRVR